MKKIILITVLTMFSLSFKTEAKSMLYPGGFGLFYSELAPYGTWIQLDAGVYCWRPTILSIGWAPYLEGRWEWTSYGWYWDSYEPFGYIVYHYGRWYYDDYYGWIWIPDDQWAPAWVEWRYDNDYIGWCPLPPYATFSVNIGIHFTHNYYSPFYHWHFVTYRYFNDPYVYHHFVGPKYKYRIYSRTKYRNDYGYRDGYVINRGVDLNYIRSRSGQTIRERQVEIIRNPGAMRNNVSGGRNNTVIRTFIPDRNELNRTYNTREFKIEKSDRRTSLDVSKIRLSPEVNQNRNMIENNRTPNNNRIEKERIQNNGRIDQNKIQERKIESNKVKKENNYRPVQKNPVIQERKVPSNQKNEVKKQERIYYPTNKFQAPENRNNNVERSRTYNQRRIEPRKETPRNNSNDRGKSDNNRRRK